MTLADFTDEALIQAASLLECENPADTRHLDHLLADHLNGHALTPYNLVWLESLVARNGDRHIPPPK